MGRCGTREVNSMEEVKTRRRKLLSAGVSSGTGKVFALVEIVIAPTTLFRQFAQYSLPNVEPLTICPSDWPSTRKAPIAAMPSAPREFMSSRLAIVKGRCKSRGDPPPGITRDWLIFEVCILRRRSCCATCGYSGRAVVLVEATRSRWHCKNPFRLLPNSPCDCTDEDVVRLEFLLYSSLCRLSISHTRKLLLSNKASLNLLERSSSSSLFAHSNSLSSKRVLFALSISESLLPLSSSNPTFLLQTSSTLTDNPEVVKSGLEDSQSLRCGEQCFEMCPYGGESALAADSPSPQRFASNRLLIVISFPH
ncbi:hypothetical protein TSMEX_010577 [Taenia solium]|eukprot:TsM_000251900 transcript=TsM_000251900 gene=TsM_000251900